MKTTVVKLIVVMLIIAFVASRVRGDFNSFKLADLVLDGRTFLYGQLLFLAYLLGGSLIWVYLTRGIESSIGPYRAMAIWFYSILGKYVPGKALLWGIRIYYYKREDGSNGTINVCRSLLLEYLGGIASGIFIFLILLTMVDLSFVSSELRIGASILLLVSLAGMHPGVIAHLTRFAGKALGLQAVTVPITVTDSLKILLLSGLNWCVLGLSIFMIAKSLFPELTWSSYPFITGSYALAGIVGFLAVFAPSGIGVREGILILALSQLMPVQTATLISIAARLVSTLGEAFCVFLSWVIESRGRRLSLKEITVT